MPHQLSESLSAEEKKSLQAHVKVINRGIHTFAEVGSALAAIQAGRLYRENHKSFEAYCRANFDYGRSYAHSLVSSALLIEDLKAADITELPRNEAQTRQLLKAADPKAAWIQVLEEAKVTAKPVTASVIKSVTGASRSAKVRSVSNKPSRGELIASITNAHEALRGDDYKTALRVLEKLVKRLS